MFPPVSHIGVRANPNNQQSSSTEARHANPAANQQHARVPAQFHPSTLVPGGAPEHQSVIVPSRQIQQTIDDALRQVVDLRQRLDARIDAQRFSRLSINHDSLFHPEAPANGSRQNASATDDVGESHERRLPPYIGTIPSDRRDALRIDDDERRALDRMMADEAEGDGDPLVEGGDIDEDALLAELDQLEQGDSEAPDGQSLPGEVATTPAAVSAEDQAIYDLIEENVPSLNCPLSLMPLQDPVIDLCGHIFERAFIVRHAQESGDAFGRYKCPLNRADNNVHELLPALTLQTTRGEIAKMLKAKIAEEAEKVSGAAQHGRETDELKNKCSRLEEVVSAKERSIKSVETVNRLQKVRIEQLENRCKELEQQKAQPGELACLKERVTLLQEKSQLQAQQCELLSRANRELTDKNSALQREIVQLRIEKVNWQLDELKKNPTG